MKMLEARVDELIPIQAIVYDWCIEDIESNFNPKKVSPVPVVKYNGAYLMGDGHHTAYVLSKRGDTVPIELLETDEDVYCKQSGVFVGADTVQGFISKCERLWLPKTERLKIKDLKIE